MTTKLCTKCDVVKTYAEFYKNAKRTDGLQVWCKVCQGAASNYNQGMAREKRRELGEALSKSHLGYLMRMGELAERAKAKLHALAVEFSYEDSKVLKDYENRLKVKGGNDGQIERKAAQGTPQFGVCSPESESVPNPG